MLPERTLRAALRWLYLLSRSSYDQAAALIRADPAYADLTRTQYATALDWLVSIKLVADSEQGFVLIGRAAQSAPGSFARVLLGATLQETQPPWLAEADSYVSKPDDMPSDLAHIANALGLPESEAVLAVRQVHRKIDLAERARIGLAGESALVQLLNMVAPGSARHVALESDGLGYDIELSNGRAVWHLEVKSTNRRGRLVVFLSRHEYEIAQLDPAWRLVTIGLTEDGAIGAVGTVPTAVLVTKAPADSTATARWESARYTLGPQDIVAGLPFFDLGIPFTPPGRFDWMPS
ncbi:protein NO VEIN domain-containing protein [Actinoplanes sp. NPDC000266]